MTTVKMSNWTNRRFLLMLLTAMSLTACDNPADDEDAGEQELITRVTIQLQEQGSGNVVNIVWSDPNGDGLGDFTGTATIRANRTYKGTIQLLNELATDPNERNITEEIKKEADEHQFFYTFSNNLAPFATITVTDRDSKGLPVGLEFDLVTNALPGGAASLAGTLNIVLSHYETITKTGTNPGNEEDVNITAPVSIVVQ